MGDLSGDPFQAARLLLTLRREGVTDPNLLKLIEATNRCDFAGAEFAGLAFEDVYLPTPCGQAVLPPLATAQILQAGALQPEETGRVLLVGAGSGYMAALAAPLCARLVAAERYRRLAREAGARLKALGYENVAVRHADGLTGLVEEGPYDRILLTGTIGQVPDTLVEALAPGGFIVAPAIDGDGGTIRLVGQGGEIARRGLSRQLQPLKHGMSAAL